MGDDYIVLLCNHNARWGTKLINKVVVRLGRHDFTDIHPIGKIHYTYPFPVLRRIQFAPGAPVAGMAHVKNGLGYDREFEAWQDAVFTEESGAGWLAPPMGKAVSPEGHAELGPLFGGGWRGGGVATYRMAHVNGRVLCNVLLSGAGGITGCEVQVNDEPPQHVQIEEGGFRTLTIPAAIRDGHLDVTIGGKGWTLSGIVPQIIMGAEEDYLFDRTWWAFGKQPWAWEEFSGKAAWNEFPPKY
jgi:hypothetical protein